MSHVSVFRTQIKNPNMETLREALEALASQLNAELHVNKEVRDRYDVVQGDYVLALPNGRVIGVRVFQGQLQIVGDPWGWRAEFDEVKNKIVQTYIHFALLRQLAEMGYQVSDVEEINGVIHGEVVRI